MDLCVLFGPCNATITGKMVNNVIKCQPNYLNDLFDTGETIGRAVETATERLQVLGMNVPSQVTKPTSTS